jgi:transposase-like protein
MLRKKGTFSLIVCTFLGISVESVCQASVLRAPAVNKRQYDKWSQEEDEALVKLYEEFGDNWAKISERMPANEDGNRRTAQQCQLRMKNVLALDIRRGDWSPEEDEELLMLHEKWGDKWGKISEGMPVNADGKRRTLNQCRQRMKCVLASDIRRDKWSREEDEALVKLYEEWGDKWGKISEGMPANEDGHRRTGKQCQARMKEVLAPDIRRGNWSPEENEALVKLYEEWGEQWAKISEEMPADTDGNRRTDLQCRQRMKLVLEKKSNP